MRILPPGGKLRVDDARKVYRVEGPIRTRTFGVHNNVCQNLCRSLVERVFRVVKNGELVLPPKPSVGQFDKLTWIKHRMSRYWGRERISPIDWSEFPKLYDVARKRSLYEKAVDSLESNGPQWFHGHVRSFIKAEILDLSTKSDPAPRAIQPRSPEYNVMLGSYLKPNEHRIYKILAKSLGKTNLVAKGVNAVQLGNIIAEKWQRFSNPVAIGMDASRFDQHVSVDALKWEHSVYLALTEPRHRLQLSRLLNQQLANKGKALARDGGYAYTTEGCRMSGDMNTSLGNCLLMVSMTATMCIDLGIKYDLINNGDDLVLIVEREDQEIVQNHVKQYYLDFGFTMVVEEPVYILEEIEFCQMHPVKVGTDYVMTRNYDVVLNKDLVTLLDITSEKRFKQWMTAISKGGGALCAGIPVLQPFYERLDFGVDSKIATHGGFQNSVAGWGAGLNKRHLDISDETRTSFGIAFKCSREEQRELELAIANWHPRY